MHDELLGELLEDELGYREGSVPYDGRQIRLSLHNDGGPWEACLALARSIVAALPEIDRKGKGAAADELLDVYNRGWREYSQPDGRGGFIDVSNPEIGADAFKAAMRLDTVSILGDMITDLWYDPGDLFLGHAINVRSFEGPAFTALRADLVG
jgi:hypothetical protein